MGEKELGLAEQPYAREAATGMATGRSVAGTNVSQAGSPSYRESGSGMATGKTTAVDDWHPQLREAGSGQASGIAIDDPGVNGMITGEDLDGDSTGERKMTPREAGSPRAAGIAIGDPGVNDNFTVDASPPEAGIAIDEQGVHRAMAAGDLDGDGMADRIPGRRESGTGQASGIAIGDPGVNGNFTVDTSPPVVDIAIDEPDVH